MKKSFYFIIGILIASLLIGCEEKTPEPIDISTISIEGENKIEMTEGDEKELKITVAPDNATDKTVIWSSSDDETLTVDQNGKIKAVKDGKAVVTVKAKTGEASATIEVTVKKKTVNVSAIVIEGSGNLGLIEGETFTLKARIVPDDATDKTIVWSSSDEEKATVDQNGKITAKASGDVTIKAATKDGQISSSVNISITPKEIFIDSLAFEAGASYAITLDSEKTLNLIMTPSNANQKELVWSSSAEDIVAVDQNGKLSPKKTGSATITAKAVKGEAKAEITVSIHPALTSIMLPTDEEAKFGTALNFKDRLTIEPGESLTDDIVWSSSDDSIGSVDPATGILTPKKLGTVTVKAKTPSGLETACEVTIHPSFAWKDDVPKLLYTGQTVYYRQYVDVLPEGTSFTVRSYGDDDDYVVDNKGGEDMKAIAEGTGTSGIRFTFEYDIDGTSYTSKKLRLEDIKVKEAFVIEQSTYHLDKGESLELKRNAPASRDYDFVTDYPGIVDIGSTGKITYSSSGFAFIEITDKESDGTAGYFNIRNTIYTELPSEGSDVAMEVNDKMYITSHDGSILDGAVSSNPDIVSIDEKGRLTAMDHGSSTITVGGTTFTVSVYTWIPKIAFLGREYWDKEINYSPYISIFGELPADAFYNYQGDTYSGFDAIAKFSAEDHMASKTLDLTKLVTETDTIKSYQFKSSKASALLLPETIKTIESDAFYYANIKSLTIPSSVTSIQDTSFNKLNQLETLVFDASVENIDGIIFYNISDTLQSLTLPSTLKTYTHSNNGLVWEKLEKVEFKSCEKITCPTFSGAFPGSSSRSPLKTVILPDNLNEIGSSAFKNCPLLEETSPGTGVFIIPENVKKIGNDAFYGCSSLKTVAFPSGLQSIGESAFEKCTNLHSSNKDNPNDPSFIIPTGASLADRAFTECNNLEYVTLPTNATMTTIPMALFVDCKNLKSVTMPSSITTIGTNAFYGCPLLETVNMPETVTSIGFYAFKGCETLKLDHLPASLESINGEAFSGCKAITIGSLPDKITLLDNGAFNGCESITSITIPGSLENLGNRLFEGCSSLKGTEKDAEGNWIMVIPSNITLLQTGCFSGTAITHIKIPAALQSQVANAFGGTTPTTVETY